MNNTYYIRVVVDPAEANRGIKAIEGSLRAMERVANAVRIIRIMVDPSEALKGVKTVDVAIKNITKAVRPITLTVNTTNAMRGIKSAEAALRAVSQSAARASVSVDTARALSGIKSVEAALRKMADSTAAARRMKITLDLSSVTAGIKQTEAALRALARTPKTIRVLAEQKVAEVAPKVADRKVAQPTSVNLDVTKAVKALNMVEGLLRNLERPRTLKLGMDIASVIQAIKKVDAVLKSVTQTPRTMKVTAEQKVQVAPNTVERPGSRPPVVSYDPTKTLTGIKTVETALRALERARTLKVNLDSSGVMQGIKNAEAALRTLTKTPRTVKVGVEQAAPVVAPRPVERKVAQPTVVAVDNTQALAGIKAVQTALNALGRVAPIKVRIDEDAVLKQAARIDAAIRKMASAVPVIKAPVVSSGDQTVDLTVKADDAANTVRAVRSRVIALREEMRDPLTLYINTSGAALSVQGIKQDVIDLRSNLEAIKKQTIRVDVSYGKEPRASRGPQVQSEQRTHPIFSAPAPKPVAPTASTNSLTAMDKLSTSASKLADALGRVEKLQNININASKAVKALDSITNAATRALQRLGNIKKVNVTPNVGGVKGITDQIAALNKEMSALRGNTRRPIDVKTNMPSRGGRVSAQKESDGLFSQFGDLISPRGLLSTAVIVHGVKEVGALADSYTGLENRMKIVVGAGGDVAGSLDKVFAAAQRSRTDIDSFGRTAQAMAGATREMGLSFGDAIRLTETLSKQIKINGSTTSEAASTITQFGQALRKGKLDGDELRSIAENSETTFRALAKTMGVTTGELYDLGRAGKITREIMVKSLLDTASETDEAYKSLGLRFSDTWEMFKNEASRVIGEFSKNADLVGLFGDALGTLASTMKLVAAVASPVASAIRSIGKATQEVSLESTALMGGLAAILASAAVANPAVAAGLAASFTGAAAVELYKFGEAQDTLRKEQLEKDRKAYEERTTLLQRYLDTIRSGGKVEAQDSVKGKEPTDLRPVTPRESLRRQIDSFSEGGGLFDFKKGELVWADHSKRLNELKDSADRYAASQRSAAENTQNEIRFLLERNKLIAESVQFDQARITAQETILGIVKEITKEVSSFVGAKNPFEFADATSALYSETRKPNGDVSTPLGDALDSFKPEYEKQAAEAKKYAAEVKSAKAAWDTLIGSVDKVAVAEKAIVDAEKAITNARRHGISVTKAQEEQVLGVLQRRKEIAEASADPYANILKDLDAQIQKASVFNASSEFNNKLMEQKRQLYVDNVNLSTEELAVLNRKNLLEKGLTDHKQHQVELARQLGLVTAQEQQARELARAANEYGVDTPEYKRRADDIMSRQQFQVDIYESDYTKAIQELDAVNEAIARMAENTADNNHLASAYKKQLDGIYAKYADIASILPGGLLRKGLDEQTARQNELLQSAGYLSSEEQKKRALVHAANISTQPWELDARVAEINQTTFSPKFVTSDMDKYKQGLEDIAAITEQWKREGMAQNEVLANQAILLQALDKQFENTAVHQMGIIDGIAKGWREAFAEMGDTSQQAADLMRQSLLGVRDAFVELVVDGKTDWESFVFTILRGLSTIATNVMITELTKFITSLTRATTPGSAAGGLISEAFSLAGPDVSGHAATGGVYKVAGPPGRDQVDTRMMLTAGEHLAVWPRGQDPYQDEAPQRQRGDAGTTVIVVRNEREAALTVMQSPAGRRVVTRNIAYNEAYLRSIQSS